MQTMLPLIPAGSTQINEIVSVSTENSEWIYYLGHLPIYSHQEEDSKHFRLIIAQLVENGLCRQCEIIKTFGVTKNKVHRARKQLRERGAASFFKRRRGRKGGNVLTPEKLNEAQKFLDRGKSRREISDKLKVKYDTLRKAINDGRLEEKKREAVHDISTAAERNKADLKAGETMGTACTRIIDRVAASFGKLETAPIEFENASDVVNGGVLCALPALLANGLLTGIKRLGKIKGFYGKIHILLAMAYLYLCRIKTVEELRKYSPGEFGKLIGLDRIPENRCFRKKLTQLAGDTEAENWAAFLADRWMQERNAFPGFLYIDGHVDVYSGKNKLPKRYVSRQRLCLRGISTYWVNDAVGTPFFFVEKQIDRGLLQTLREDIIPKLLKSVPDQPGEKALANNKNLCRFILVFDREGYSPEFFLEMWEKYRIACITYRKYADDPWPKEKFKKYDVKMPRGETVEMKLAEKEIKLEIDKKRSIKIREIRKLTDSGHQTSVITTAYSLEITFIAAYMFTRWCQENFFGYAVKHLPVGLLTEYGSKPFSGTETVVNPKWRNLDREVRSVTSKLTRRQAKLIKKQDEKAADPNHRKHDEWLIEMSDVKEEVESLKQRKNEINSEKKTTPHYIKWKELSGKDKFNKLPSSRRRLVSTVAMIAYRAETVMANIISDNDTVTTTEARAILQALFTTSADIRLREKEKILTIRIHGASTPKQNKILNNLFSELNNTETIYPGTKLKMIFKSMSDSS